MPRPSCTISACAGSAPGRRRKLLQLHEARTLAELSAIPGNRLEALKADRAGQFSIRVNERFGICFTWVEEQAGNVEIVDYH